MEGGKKGILNALDWDHLENFTAKEKRARNTVRVSGAGVICMEEISDVLVCIIGSGDELYVELCIF